MKFLRKGTVVACSMLRRYHWPNTS